MFDLEKSITKWREQMLASGIQSPAPLDELETHLREEIRTLVSAGTSEDESFRLAAARVGSPNQLSAEFDKPHGTLNLTEMAGRFGLLLIIFLAAVLAVGKWSSGKWNLLLAAHVFCVVVGYFTVLLTGGLGIYHVCSRFFQWQSSSKGTSLNRMAGWLNLLAAGLILAGYALGIIWSKQNLGGYQTDDPRAVGAFYVCLWLFASCAVQRNWQLTPRNTATLCIIGNILVCLAWFGGGMLAHRYQDANYWPLHALVGGHLLFLLISLAPDAKMAEARNDYV
jgi:hypothetical protein